MKILFGLLTAAMFYFSIVSAGALNHQTEISIIEVGPGDTVWTIAAKHSTDRQDIREVVSVIRHLNQLDQNGRIYPGQSLRVPQTSM